jgi:choline dehydrogenase-like flavoprotein
MANDEHVALLKQGVPAWNAWRGENPGIRPDLREADLRIDPCYLSNPNDTRALRDGFRIVREVVRQKPGSACTSAADIDAHIRMTATTVQHASCTCRMGRDESAVVDGQLRVRGVERLRVVDASVMPEILSCNIHAAVLAIAERASDLIRGHSESPVETARRPLAVAD